MRTSADHRLIFLFQPERIADSTRSKHKVFGCLRKLEYFRQANAIQGPASHIASMSITSNTRELLVSLAQNIIDTK